jgi:hypothetical protein
LEPGAQHLIATFFWKPLLMPPFRHLNTSSGAHPALPKTPWVSNNLYDVSPFVKISSYKDNNQYLCVKYAIQQLKRSLFARESA